MHVITKKALTQFWGGYPDAEAPLRVWYTLVSKNDFDNFAELKNAFRSVDKVGRYTVFNIGGNKYRLIVIIHYFRRKVYVRHVLTHAEYDRALWKRE